MECIFSVFCGILSHHPFTRCVVSLARIDRVEFCPHAIECHCRRKDIIDGDRLILRIRDAIEGDFYLHLVSTLCRIRVLYDGAGSFLVDDTISIEVPCIRGLCSNIASEDISRIYPECHRLIDIHTRIRR